MEREVIFGRNFKKYRKQKGISQKEFARLLYEATGKQLTLTSVSNYETGLHLPPSQILPVIAGIFGVSIDDLFGIEKAASTPGEEPLEASRGWKELEKLKSDFRSWKRKAGAAGKEAVAPAIALGEQLIEIAEKQQKELHSGQVRLVAVRKMVDGLKGKFE